MKRTKWILGAMPALAVVMAIGCAKKDDSAPAPSGNCSKSLAQDYTAVSTAYEHFTSAPEVGQVELKNACDAFFTHQSTRTCTSQEWITQEDVALVLSEIESKCKDAEQAATPSSEQKGFEAGQSQDSEPSRDSLQALMPTLNLEIMSSRTINFMLTEATQPYYLIEGRLQPLSAISNYSKAACTLKIETARKAERISAAQVFSIRSTSHFQRGSKTFTFVFLNSNDLVIECVKDGARPASVADLREAFGNLIAIKSIEPKE